MCRLTARAEMSDPRGDLHPIYHSSFPHRSGPRIHLPSGIPHPGRAATPRSRRPRIESRLVTGHSRSATDAPTDPEADRPRARPKAPPFTIDNSESKTELSMVNGGNEFEKEVRGQTKVRQRSTRTDAGPTPCDIRGETFILISRPKRAKRAPPSVPPSVRPSTNRPAGLIHPNTRSPALCGAYW